MALTHTTAAARSQAGRRSQAAVWGAHSYSLLVAVSATVAAVLLLAYAGKRVSASQLLPAGDEREVVRTVAEFGRTTFLSSLLLLLPFHAVAVYWRARQFQGDPWLLPSAHLLTGLGAAAMLAVRDPLRDRLIVFDFASGVALGCLALAAFSSISYQRSARKRLMLVPFAAALLLSLALVLFGSGPGTSDAKVNLFGVQPVEAIRLLLVLFLAAYFAEKWEFIRHLRETQFGGLQLPGRFRVPRYDHVLPVIVAVVLALGLFALQKDLGPALILTAVFLTLYAIARARAVLALLGMVLLLAAFAAASLIGYPTTVATRIAMWRSPWENAVRGGEHVAQALWAFASGGGAGTGLGLGEPWHVREAHTDMVLAALGEELGFAGMVVVALLFAVLTARGVQIARRAIDDYGVFLAIGIAASLLVPTLLIASGVLGLFPLSGVSTPFLSYGKSAMVANFAMLGILYGLSRENRAAGSATGEGQEPRFAAFATPVRTAGMLASVAAGVLLVRAADLQLFRADATMARSALALQADGELRSQENPRLKTLADTLPRGAIVDRRGLPLAVASCEELKGEKSKPTPVRLDVPCDPLASRHYALGDHTYHLLGDARSRVHWSASNTTFAERDRDARLRGFNDHAALVERPDPRTGRAIRVAHRDYAELVPLWRYRHRPGHPAVAAFNARPRDLRLTVDARLQLGLSQAFDRHLASLGQARGAVVVLDAASGDLLAMVNAPRPKLSEAAVRDFDPSRVLGNPAWLDRARYGLYPPGSTFKMVTAIAALREDPTLAARSFVCRRLPDGRVGQTIPGWTRPIRDDEQDRQPHGSVTLQNGLEQSCNAYFAQLALVTGAGPLHRTAALFDVATARPDTVDGLRDMLPQAGYGQGEVLMTPFKMARVAAAIANGGRMPHGRWVIDDPEGTPVEVLTSAGASQLATYLRGAVERGTGRVLASVQPAVAGKTGTAEVSGAPSHSWFAGFAPYGPHRGRRVAFAILIENGGYGGRAAAPVARTIVQLSRELGLLESGS